MTTTRAPCGSTAAYQQHFKAKEEPCDLCRAANTIYMRERRAVKPEYRKNSARASRVRQAALRRLAERHPEEFDALLEEARQEVR